MRSGDNKLQKKLDLLGINMQAKTFTIFRLVSSLILFLILLFISKAGFIIAPIATILYYFLVEIVAIDLTIRRRAIRLEYDALEFFPVFLLSLKGGRNVKKAINISTDVVDNELSREFKKVLKNIKLGKSLEESLLILESRIPSDNINNILINIREANRFGNDISASINNHLSLINEKYNKSILKTYRYVPLQLTIVSISFVFMMLSILIILNMFL